MNLFIYLFLAVLGLRCCTQAFSSCSKGGILFVAARGLSLVAARGGYSSLWCTGFSLRWLFLLRSMGSRCAGFSSCDTQPSVVVARGLSSCGLQAQ